MRPLNHSEGPIGSRQDRLGIVMEINWRRSWDWDLMNVRMMQRVGIFGLRVKNRIK